VGSSPANRCSININPAGMFGAVEDLFNCGPNTNVAVLVSDGT
jgi:hypothetical protein